MLCSLIYEWSGYSCHWVPYSSLLMFNCFKITCEPQHDSCLVDVTRQQDLMVIASSPANQPLSFSPSGQLVADNWGAPKQPRITCVNSGSQVWRGNIGAEKDFGNDLICGPFLPSGCGLVVCDFDHSQHSSMLHVLRWSKMTIECHVWEGTDVTSCSLQDVLYRTSRDASKCTECAYT